MRTAQHYAGQEPFPLQSDNTNIRKPQIKILASKDRVLACLWGPIDIDTSPALREPLLALLQAPYPKKVSIDLSAVPHIDSSGIATLIEALRIARRNKIELRLQGLEDRLLRLFEVTGILSLFNGSAQTTSQSGSEVV
jgi:anti-sigma B factor antagonist